MTDFEGRELDEALWLASGRTKGLSPGSGRKCWFDGHTVVWVLPEYHKDVTALLRDIEPVCRERGMCDWTLETWYDEGYRSSVSGQEYEMYTSVIAPTAATALARAFLAVLTRGES